MLACTLNYKLAYDEFKEAMAAVRRIQRRAAERAANWNRTLILIAAIFVVLITVSLLLFFLDADTIPNSWRKFSELPDSTIWIILAILCIPAGYRAITANRRLWKEHKRLELPHTLTVTDLDLVESWESIRIQISWKDAKEWVETPHTITIISSVGFFIVPKHSIRSSDIGILKSLLTAHLPNPTYAFPIEVPTGTISRSTPE